LYNISEREIWTKGGYIMYTGHPIVDAITALKISEKDILNYFFKSVKKDGKPYFNAAVVLFDIIHLYRAKPIFENGKITKYVKKFQHDKLQKSYQALADQF